MENYHAKDSDIQFMKSESNIWQFIQCPRDHCWQEHLLSIESITSLINALLRKVPEAHGLPIILSPTKHEENLKSFKNNTYVFTEIINQIKIKLIY